MNKRIKINVREDSMGNLVLTPIVDRYCEQITEYLKEFNVDSDGSVLIQMDYEVATFLDDCNPSHRRDIRQGWGCNILFDAWTFLVMVGWDASEGLSLN